MMSIVPGRDIPEAPEAWIDAINARINDENHDDLCGCNKWPTACPWYTPGQWDEGIVLHIAAAVLEPLIRERLTAVSRWWLLWGPDRTLDDFTEFATPRTREQAAAALAAERDMPSGALEPTDEATVTRLRGLPAGTVVRRDELNAKGTRS